MSTPYVGEIRMLGFPRVPTGWFACDGSLKPIAEYEVLYTLIGTTYGGDGQQTFAVPDLRGSAAVHQGNGQGLTPRTIGEKAGTENVTLLPANLPQHNHIMLASSATATTITPGPSNTVAAMVGDNLYIPDVSAATPVSFAPQSITLQGGNLPHDNMMPTLTVNYCIAWAGLFPSQN